MVGNKYKFTTHSQKIESAFYIRGVEEYASHEMHDDILMYVTSRKSGGTFSCAYPGYTTKTVHYGFGTRVSEGH